jgi:hypothetical protein
LSRSEDQELTISPGEAHRDTVFTTCSLLLVAAAIVVHKTLS